MLAALPSGKNDPAPNDPTPYLAAASCLRKQNPGTHSPQDSLLKARAPAAKQWLKDQMERARMRADPPQVLDMAYLAEAKAFPDADIQKELASLYLVVADTYRAGMALLRQSEADSLQTGYIQYQLENLTRYPGSELSASALLDSLTGSYPHRKPITAELLETLSWSVRDYPAAYRNLLAWMDLKRADPKSPKGADPSLVIERVNRFQSLGYFDYSAALLGKLEWRRLPQPWYALARTLDLQVRSRLQDWPGIIAAAGDPGRTGVTATLRGTAINGEETFLIADAHLHLGHAEEALAGAVALEKSGEPPWAFRGRLLKARALTAMGKTPEAARTLDALKRDPKRREATGPILFWQGCLALDEGRYPAAESLLVLASAYTGAEESQRALEYRFFLLQDTTAARRDFFRGLPESPHDQAERARSLDRVGEASPLWPFAQLEKAQIHLQNGDPDSAEAVFDRVAKRSPDRMARFQAEAKAAFTAEKLPGGRQAALARYEDLLIKYQQGVIPEFSRERIKALR
jgi:tetratricopeptide (TPR) repeat protein